MTTSPSDVTAPPAPLDPTDPLRGCDRCGPGAKASVLTAHGADLHLTLAWCGHCFTARERLGLLRNVIDDRRQWS